MSKQSFQVALLGSVGKFVASTGQFNQDGHEVQRMVKDMIALGVYTHPIFGWTLDVTEERLDRWVGAFKVMTENGIKVPITLDHSEASDDCQGYVVDMYRQGDKLMGVHELVGQEAITLALKVQQVSVLIEKEFIDGMDRNYGEAITHSSITPNPIVPGQEPFVPVAASRSGQSQSAPVFVLTADKGKRQSSKGAPAMTDEQLKAIQQALGAGDDLEADSVATRIAERLEAGKTEKADLEKKVVDLTAEVEALKKTAEEQGASRTEPKVDPDLLDDLAESAESRIDNLVDKGKVVASVAASLKDLLIGKPGARNAFALSRKVSQTNESLVKGLCKALEQNDVVKLGETLGAQVTLSRSVPDGDAKDHDPDVTKEMIDQAGGPAKD